MLYLWSILLILLNACWLMLVVFSLPGNWLIVISTFAFAWWRWEEGVFSIYTLIVIAALAVVGELVEFFASMFGAKGMGASWSGSIAAIVGAITGAVAGTFLIPVPFFGTLLGACVGAGLFAWGVELVRGRKMGASVRYGVGAGLGRFVGTSAKVILGVFIWLIVAVAAFWP